MTAPATLATVTPVVRTGTGATRVGRFGFALCLAPLLLVVFGLRSAGGPAKVAQVLDALALAALVAARAWRHRTPVPLPGPLMWALAGLGVALVSAGTAVDRALAAKQVQALVLGIGLAAALATACATRERALTAVRVLVLGSIPVCGPAAYAARHLDARYRGSVVNGRPVGIFAQPNELGAFAMMVLLLALGLLIASPQRRDRWLGGVGAACGTAALLASLSRGSWIGAVLGVGTMVLLSSAARRALVRAAVVLVGVGAVLSVVAPGLLPLGVVGERFASIGSAQQGPYDERPLIWAEAVRQLEDRPWTGQGPGGYSTVAAGGHSVATSVHPEHGHDVVLTVAAETGVPGVLALAGLTVSVGLSLRAAVRRARGDRLLTGLLTGVAAALVGLVGEGLVDFTLRNAVVAQTAWAVTGLALTLCTVARGTRTDVPRQERAAA